MPVRFQVDADFYDHPKTIGISDAACALWVKAGSFSAAKTTDGFIADDVLAHTLRYDRTAAEELVRRGLWKRVRGGFRYHQWADRNLTRERIEGDRKADRERKKAQRAGDEAPTKGNRASKNNMPSDARTGEEQGTHEGGSEGTEQVKPQNVRPESERNPPGIQPESKGIPGASVSVSVSESVSVSGSGRDAVHSPPPIGAPPPPKCPTHKDDPNPPPCGPCADARRAHQRWETEHEQWEAEHAEWLRTAPKCGKHRGQPAHNCAPCRGEALAAE